MAYSSLIAIKEFIIFNVRDFIGERGAAMREPIMDLTHDSEILIRALIFRDPTVNAWVAQGLDLDICAQARTLEDVHRAFEKAIVSTAAVAIELGQEPFEGIGRAPEKFFELFERAQVRTAVAEDGPKYMEPVPTPPFRPEFRVVDQLVA